MKQIDFAFQWLLISQWIWLKTCFSIKDLYPGLRVLLRPLYLSWAHLVLFSSWLILFKSLGPFCFFNLPVNGLRKFAVTIISFLSILIPNVYTLHFFLVCTPVPTTSVIWLLSPGVSSPPALCFPPVLSLSCFICLHNNNKLNVPMYHTCTHRPLLHSNCLARLPSNC